MYARGSRRGHILLRAVRLLASAIGAVLAALAIYAVVIAGWVLFILMYFGGRLR